MQRATILSVGVVLTLVAALASADSIRVKMGELHGGGGVPPGWKFSMPRGDAGKGKEVFEVLECGSCHEVAGEGFPAKATDKTGPALTGMGAHHPAEYFAESILDPNAVIVTDVPDWVGPDGRSKMPSYNESLTLEQWVNLVAYLGSLKVGRRHDMSAGHQGPGGHEMHAGHEMHGPERDKTVGEYRVQLDYTEPEDEKHPGYLAVSISDAATGQAVPYLSVRVRIGSGKSARSVTLKPTIGPAGPQYGAAVLVPDETESLTVLVGAATVPVKSVEGGKYRTPRRVSFVW